jgi:hypothetical protein
MEQAIFKARPRQVVLENGATIYALELPDGLGLYKGNALMEPVGELDGLTIYHWLSEGPQLEAIKASGGYLGPTWDELPGPAYKAVMEVEIPDTDPDGNPTVRRVKLVEADALGHSYTPGDVLPPHQWAGWE